MLKRLHIWNVSFCQANSQKHHNKTLKARARAIIWKRQCTHAHSKMNWIALITKALFVKMWKQYYVQNTISFKLSVDWSLKEHIILSRLLNYYMICFYKPSNWKIIYIYNKHAVMIFNFLRYVWLGVKNRRKFFIDVFHV